MSAVSIQSNDSNDSQLKSTRKSSISFRAPHLSEFYRFVSGSGSGTKQLVGQTTNERGHTRQQSSISTGQGLTRNRRFSTSTMDTGISLTPSIFDLPMIISSRDRDEFEQVLKKLSVASKNYAQALSSVSSAASEFGLSLEGLARLKGSHTQSQNLMTCAGLHFLISNHQQVLASSIEQQFQHPLDSIIVNFKSKTSKNDQTFNRELRSRIKHLKSLEGINYRIAKSKKRNLVTYKDTLKRINDQIDSIDGLKYNYYDSLSKLIQDTNGKIIKNCCTVAKAEFEIYENIARKGWTGGGMDELLVDCPDPFGDETETEIIDEEEDSNEEEKLNSSTNARSEQPNGIHQQQRQDDSIFHTKLSTSKKSPRKPQLVNTKNALTIQDDVFSNTNGSRALSPTSISSSANFFPANISQLSIKDPEDNTSAPTNGLGVRTNSEVADKNTESITDRTTEEISKDKTNKAPSTVQSDPQTFNITTLTDGDTTAQGKESTLLLREESHDNPEAKSDHAKEDSNNADDLHTQTEGEGTSDDEEDDNSFSLPLPSNLTYKPGLPNQPLFKNAWND